MGEFNNSEPSKGLGDTVAKITHATGIAKLTEVITDALGIEDCGCNRRQEYLNNVFSYNTQPIIEYNDGDEIEEGVYEISQSIFASKQGETFQFNVGDKVLITKEHLLYSDWPYYLKIGAVKPSNKTL